MYSCGTLQKKRRHLPKELEGIKLKEQGSSHTFQCKEERIYSVPLGWTKKRIGILSTNVNDNIVKVKRRKGADKNEINCPLAFSLYNKYIGGVDLADRNRKY
ncbi:hypothetical protein JTE90_015750 [Oedothorax gibbosus]|uniref:PiggyBac transposable element-derived protein domain-containing protein n=1 Tax=Oedothorax gibbosus TaxID=931172 RepID=A0AAV6TSA0_9ARAC|nr:hypothetical protein JTE90_015750 [Oedothorax gibbosus]